MAMASWRHTSDWRKHNIVLVGLLIILCNHLVHAFVVVQRPSIKHQSLSKQQTFRTLFASVSDDDYLLGPTDDSSQWQEETNEDLPEEDREGDNLNNDENLKNDTDNTLWQSYTQWARSVEKTQTALTKKQTSLSNELAKAEKVQETMHRAQLITSNMYLFADPSVKTATVNDWENDGQEVTLTLDGQYDSASAEADALFTQARKVKRGASVVQELLEETANALTTLEEIVVDLEACCQSAVGDDETQSKIVDEHMFLLVQDRLLRSSRQTGFKAPSEKEYSSSSKQQRTRGRNGSTKKPALGTPASNVRKLLSPGGCVVLVGRNRRGNEHLTFSVARDADVWMHSRGCPGAHVVLQQRRGSPPATDACIQFAADLAIFYSDARGERSFDVTSAEPKHLLKPRGAPLGAVKLREESKIYTGYPDQVSDELKQARDESGQEELFRFADKSKHRKRTKLAAKQQQEKNRARIKEKKKKKASSRN